MSVTFRLLRALVIILAMALLAGCAQQLIRDEATTYLREGNYEEALRTLEGGLVRFPDSVAMRSGLITARGEATVRIIAESSRLRAAGRFEEALALLKRAKALEPKNDRVNMLLAETALDQQLQVRLDEASSLAAAGKKDEALRSLELALRLSPRQPVLLALQRRIQSELRVEADDSGRRALAEARPITLDFRNAALSTVLEAITQRSGVNFILDRDVRTENRTTVYLRSIPLGDAIDLVLGAQQLARRTIDRQTILIYPNTPEKQREHQEQVLRVFYLVNADAKSTAAMLRSLLRIREPYIDERANYVAIRETPDLVTLAERLVALHDTSDAEVMLEVEVLEVKTSRLAELGINFPNSFSLTPLAPTGGTALTIGNLRSINSDRVGVGVSGLLFNLRREVGDFNTLANPRIRAKNREKARIVIGDKVPIVTSTTTSTGFVAESVNYLDVGLKLDVEPIVSPDDEVTIKLALEVSSIVKEIKTAAGSLAFQIGTRNATTTLRLRDGETQVLGGLMSNEDRSTSNRVPGLGDLPIAGRLFSSQKDDVQRTELVLAITPRILRSAPRPDIAQSELWVGTEALTRLRPPPGRPVAGRAATADATAAAANDTSVASARTADSDKPVPPKLTWQSPAEVKVGDLFTVRLALESEQLLRGAPFEIQFPPDVLEVVQVTEGNFFKRDAAPTSFTQSVSATSKRIGVGMLRSGDAGASGAGNLIEMQLRAKAAGPIELSFASLRLFAAGGPIVLDSPPVLRIVAK